MNGRDGESRDQQTEIPPGAKEPRGALQRKPSPGTFARLKKRSQFLAAAKGIRHHEPAFTIQAIAQGTRDDEPMMDAPRFGLTITKKTGNAVVRNRIRRRLREALRLSPKARGEMADGVALDYVIVARRDALTRDFAALAVDLDRAMTQADRRLTGKAAAKKRQDKPTS
jgi:ribonuclease P protein component